MTPRRFSFLIGRDLPEGFGQSSKLLYSGSRWFVGSQLTLVIGPQANNSAAAFANGVDFIDEHDRPELDLRAFSNKSRTRVAPAPTNISTNSEPLVSKAHIASPAVALGATSCRCQVSHPLYSAPNIDVDLIKTYPTNTARMVVQFRALAEAERSFTCFSLSLARLAPMATATEHF